MSTKKPRKKRTHAGLCLDLLDEEHKLLIAEMAWFVNELAGLHQRTPLYWGVSGTRCYRQCRVCLARSAALESYDPDKADQLTVEHRPDCEGLWAAKLMEKEPVLSLLVGAELLRPSTAMAKARQAAREAEHKAASSAATSQAEVAP